MTREEVIRGLRCCAGDGGVSRVCPEDCPYMGIDETEGLCDARMIWDAIRLLEEDNGLEDDGK